MRWSFAILALLAVAGCAHRRAQVGLAGSLPAPALVTPRDQAVLTNHPRTVRFSWSRVPQATGYGIEIDCYGCCVRDHWCSEAQGMDHIVPNLTAITYTFTFWGDQKGRWRVWGVDAKSRPGRKSAWSSFAFQAARESTDKPSPFGSPAGRGR